MGKFEGEFWQKNVLPELSKLSDNELDQGLARRMQEFSELPLQSDIVVWNFLKEMLDMCVHIGGGSSFVMTVLDVEAANDPPCSSLNEADGSIKSAQWRIDNEPNFGTGN